MGNENDERIKEARKPKRAVEPDTQTGSHWMGLIKKQEDIAHKLKAVLRRVYGGQLGNNFDRFCSEITHRATHPRAMPPIGSDRSEWRDDQYPNGVPDEKIGIDYDEALDIAKIVMDEWNDRLAQ